MNKLTALFGELVFNDSIMRERLPKVTYKQLRATVDTGSTLDSAVADIVAGAMKDWAIEQGATHFTHWFQPMTGVTAEKHDSFIAPTSDGRILTEFSGKELIKGEPDASSFPSGGLRATFEARGYTAWDCSSPAFIKDKTLYIPTAFCSYTGDALDKKTPLLRSMDALSKAGIRMLRLLGNEHSQKVFATAGPEQEYFLVEEELFKKRRDLMYCGRTLFGAPPPKGQELEDQYYAAISDKVAAYMHELDEELWRLGIPAKTKHNEAAPAQHELAAVFNTCNIATDQNQLTMEMMKKVALRNSLVCLLHEKPFRGVNGSGKHNNWSLSTDDGINLLDGRNLQDNLGFLVFLVAVIKAVDEYASLIRCSAAIPGNDQRLGSHEAPPNVISIYLGTQLDTILSNIANEESVEEIGRDILHTGASVLPELYRDSTDRNRTSPFAFTGNRFEFRTVGSSDSVADANTVVNTAVAQVLEEMCDELEKCDNIAEALPRMIAETYAAHKRVVFNGDNYRPEWLIEARKRGLPNLSNTVDALGALLDEKNMNLFIHQQVLSATELHARYDIMIENYSKVIRVEALTMLSMAQTQLIPAIGAYVAELASQSEIIERIGEPAMQKALCKELNDHYRDMVRLTGEISQAVEKARHIQDITQRAYSYRDEIIPIMEALRKVADSAELIMPSDRWPLPTYGELLFSVN